MLALLIAIFALSFSSCEKDDTSEFVGIAKTTSLYALADIHGIYNFSVMHRVLNDTALLHNDTAIIDSALVTRIAEPGGLVSYVVDYGQQTLARDGRIKSGKILVSSYPDSIPDGALAIASFSDYTIDDIPCEGSFKYIRTGEVVGGQPEFYFKASIGCSYYALGQAIALSEKYFYQTAGMAEPLKFDLLRFDMKFATYGWFIDYASNDYTGVKFNTEMKNPWQIDFGCAKILRPAEATITVKTSDGKIQRLIESLIDTDLDGCVDKVMLKDDKNFGFPFYI